MKKIIISLLIGLFVIIAISIFTITIKFKNYKAKDISIAVDESALNYFQESYEECRCKFISTSLKMKENYPKIIINGLKIPGKMDDELTIDYTYIPAKIESKTLLIISSGIHGVEGYTGSAVQLMVMEELLENANLSNLGILLIHGMNPYGFKNKLRFTENNVDLNRNCSHNPKLYESKNQGYTQLYDMLNPEGEVNTSDLKHVFFPLIGFAKIAKESIGVLRQAILQGQYEYPEGLYFGGENLEPSIHAITPVIHELSKDYEKVMNIDLHTGYGARGKLHLFPNPIEDKQVKNDLGIIFEGYDIDWGDGDDFYTVTGDFTGYIGRIQPEKHYLPMLFEYGTMNSQTTLGSMKSIHNMILINQAVQNGYASEKDEAKIEDIFLEMYYPSSKLWRTKVINDSKEILKQVLVKL